MQEVLYYSSLYDIYKDLLTEKQQKYFEEYYFLNLSLQELADNYKVSKNAVYKQVQNATKKLVYYESKLKLLKKKEILEDIIEQIDDNNIKKKIIKII